MSLVSAAEPQPEPEPEPVFLSRFITTLPSAFTVFFIIVVSCVFAVIYAVASFRRGWGSADPQRIVKCESFALSVSSKGSLYISHNGR